LLAGLFQNQTLMPAASPSKVPGVFPGPARRIAAEDGGLSAWLATMERPYDRRAKKSAPPVQAMRPGDKNALYWLTM